MLILRQNRRIAALPYYGPPFYPEMPRLTFKLGVREVEVQSSADCFGGFGGLGFLVSGLGFLGLGFLVGW